MKKTNVVTVLQGVVMGIVETIPGVSGSTLALIMGIYDNFVHFLHDLSDFAKTKALFLVGKRSFKQVLKSLKDVNWNFGGFLAFGMLLGIAVFSHIMSFMLDNFPSYTFAFFFALILSSITIPWKGLKSVGTQEYVIAGLSAIVFFFVLGLQPAVIVGSPNRVLIFVAGYFGISAMMLPGVSGSFVMLLFGVYDYVIDSITDLTSLSISTAQGIDLGALTLGLVFGFTTFVRLLKWLLKKYPQCLMSVLVGLMIASLRILWPFIIFEGGHSVKRVLPTEIYWTELVVILLIGVVTFFGMRRLEQSLN